MSTGSSDRWYDEVRAINDRHFYGTWQDRLRQINERYRLTDDRVLLTHGRNVPPAWFNGDIEKVEAGNWVLMVSLNPRIDPFEQHAIDWYDRQDFNPQSWWKHWCRFNTEHWYWKFFRPRARLAARALGRELPRHEERGFATERMIFIELCPYGSKSFALPTQVLQELAEIDAGFQIAARVRHLLIGQGRPRVIVVNGNAAVADFSALDQGRVYWNLCSYDSVEAVTGRRPGRTLWHKQGYYRTDSGEEVPLIGSPFLRSIHGANWNSEIDQLGEHIRLFLESSK